MKKTTIILLVLLFSVNVFAQDPKEVVQKCVNALGGEEALKKYSDIKAKGEVKLSMRGMDLPAKMETIKKGRKAWIRIELKFGIETYLMIIAYDGKIAWMDRFGTIVDQPALNYESDFDHNVSLLIEKDAKFTFAKEKEIEGKKAFGIDVDFKGKKTTFYIDEENYTLLEMVFTDLYFGEKFTKETLEKKSRFADYKMLDGVNFPTKVTVYQKGKKQMEIHYSEVVFNPEVAPAKFARPDQALDLRYREELIN